MRVQCKACRIEYEIPDEKVPQGKAVRIICPKCKAPTESRAKSAQADIEGQASHPSEHFQAEPEADPILDDANAIDVVDDGVKTALVCDTNAKRAEMIAQALQELDFWVVHALRPAFALGKLHHNNYDLIILEEHFDSDKRSENLVLHHVQVLPMHLRRQFYLCLLSNEKTTLDSRIAFTMGVNLILNIRDIEKAKVLLARAMKEYRNFYGIFNAEIAKRR